MLDAKFLVKWNVQLLFDDACYFYIPIATPLLKSILLIIQNLGSMCTLLIKIPLWAQLHLFLIKSN